MTVADNAGPTSPPSTSVTAPRSPTSPAQPKLTTRSHLCRLRYLGTPDEWGFAAYLASRDSYEDSLLPTGSFTGTPEEALDCVCGLYLGDITAWIDTPDSRTNF